MLLRRLLPYLTASLLAAGCTYEDVDRFIPAVAKQECKRQKRCNGLTRTNGVKYCRNSLENLLYTLAELSRWEYDEQAGRACIETFREHRGDCSEQADRIIKATCEQNEWVSVRDNVD